MKRHLFEKDRCFFREFVETKVDESVSSGKGFVAESSNGFCFTRTLAITADALDGEWWKWTKIVFLVHRAMTL